MSNKIVLNGKIILELYNLQMSVFCEKITELVITLGYGSNRALIGFIEDINQEIHTYGNANSEILQNFETAKDIKILIKLIKIIIKDFKNDSIFYKKLANELKEMTKKLNDYLISLKDHHK